MESNKTNIYVDMDGTVAEWNTAASIDEVSTPGYFKERIPMENVIAALEKLSKKFNLVICSAALQDDHSVNDKKAWLKRYMPFINTKDAIFVPYGTSKYACLVKEMEMRGQEINDGDLFLDDFTKNLLDMRESSSGKIIPVKVCNGINDTNRTWDGFRVSSASNPEILARSIIGIFVSNLSNL